MHIYHIFYVCMYRELQLEDSLVHPSMFMYIYIYVCMCVCIYIYYIYICIFFADRVKPIYIYIYVPNQLTVSGTFCPTITGAPGTPTVAAVKTDPFTAEPPSATPSTEAPL